MISLCSRKLIAVRTLLDLGWDAMGRRTLLMIVSVVVASLSGCGTYSARDDARAGLEDDTSIVKTMLRSKATVQRAMQPLYSCLPEELSCYTDAGPGILTVVNQEIADFERVPDNSDNACLSEVARLYEESLDAYLQAAQGAVEGDPAAVQRAISASTELEMAYSERMSECGFAEGRLAELNTAISRTSFEIIRLTDRAVMCAETKCIVAASKRLEAKANEGISLLDEYLENLSDDDDDPACFAEAMGTFRSAFEAIEHVAVALQRGKFAAAGREGKRADELSVTAQEELAECLGA